LAMTCASSCRTRKSTDKFHLRPSDAVRHGGGEEVWLGYSRDR
jgi:nicotinate-nucleotide pyrophosphorylase